VSGSLVAEKLSSQGCEVSLYTDEPYGFYSRIKLPQFLCDEAGLCKLPSTREAPYLVHKAVKKIERDSQELLLEGGEKTPYDYLVLATGSKGRVLDAFTHAKGVSTLRTLEDALHITQTLCDPVIVLGGGLLGLEAALALLRKGFSVTVCEGASRILGRQLDESASALLRTQLESEGLVICENVKAKGMQVDKEGRIQALVAEGREPIACKTLILSLGVNAETSLAKEAGLVVDRGIVVDKNLKTSDEHIFAIGDCAQYEGQMPGILPVALAMAQSVSSNLLGEGKAYIPPILMTRFKDESLEVVSVGEVSGVSTNRLSNGRYEAYFVDKGILKGAILYGKAEHALFIRSHYLNKVTDEEISALLDF
jgi:nitrite reductase (NADH) large subunit